MDPAQELLQDPTLLKQVERGDVEIEPRPGGNPFLPSHRLYLRKGNELDSLGGGSLDRLNKLWRKHREAAFKRNMKDPNKPRILAVGDSWFHYPFGSDLLEWFVSQYALKTLASAGDELGRIVAAREYAPLVKTVDPHFFMLSAGGNDILGEGPNGDVTP